MKIIPTDAYLAFGHLNAIGTLISASSGFTLWWNLLL